MNTNTSTIYGTMPLPTGGVEPLVVELPLAWRHARSECFALSFKDIGLAVSSGAFLALHFATWISSLDYTAVANSVVLVNTVPLWVGLLTPLIARERIKRATVISIALSVIGGAVIGFGPGIPPGIETKLHHVKQTVADKSGSGQERQSDQHVSRLPGGYI